MPDPIRNALEWGAGAAGELDWNAALAIVALAAAVGLLGFVATVGVAYWIRHAEISDGGLGGAMATRGIHRLRRARGDEDRTRWICGRCRSWNAAGAKACYRGCGQRDDVRLLLPEEVAAVAAARPGPGPADGSEQVPTADDGHARR